MIVPLLLFAWPVVADDCWICDDVVELNATYAECYTSNFQVLMDAFDAEDLERQQVNFAGCSEGDESVGTRGGLLKMGALPEASATTKSVYTLSRESAVCLKELIDAYEGTLDPSVVFRLGEQCLNE
ncbi:hypothetical protein [Rosistilla oblonga]|uniref:hypothetical protein n=1 Tax=Rosistilla oblonga TaxID=2527990 RepID=UPI003A972B19